LYYFKGFVFEIISAAEQSKTKEQLDNGYKKKFLEYFPPSSWDDAYFKVQYFNLNEFVLDCSAALIISNTNPLK
ncbi:MAG: hypothetical protein AAFO76_09380, partial [Cyanobacteria bacterium J06607_15]